MARACTTGHERRPRPRACRGAWVAVVALAVVVLVHCRPDPPPTAGSAAGTVAPVPGSRPFDLSSGLARIAPEGFVASGQAQAFDQESLEEKFDELDTYYDDAGLLQAVCQRFASTSDPTRALEACVYVMENPRAAMSVFLGLTHAGPLFGREVGQRSAILHHAWEAPGFLSFTQGDAYVEITSNDPTEPGEAPRRALALSFASRYGGTVSALPPFPEQGLRPGGLRLVMRNAFGMQGLDGIYTADYRDADGEAVAFWSDCDTAEEAASIARKWLGFLRANGATEAETTLPDATVLHILGFTEIVCVRGRVVAGLHQAESAALTLRLATALCPPPDA